METISKKRLSFDGSHPLENILKNTALINKISDSCLKGDYKYSPYGEKLFVRGKGKYPREISLPTFKDQAILKCLDESLKIECNISNATKVASFLVQEIKEFLPLCQKDAIVIRLDIIGFFDNINHHILLEKIKSKDCPVWLIHLVKRAIKNPTKEKHSRDKKQRLKGIPQGISIASHLADLYLEDFDNKCSNKCIKYYRYVDDILIFVTSQTHYAILTFIESQLAELGLEFHKNGEKFQICKLLDTIGFNYLGYQFFPLRDCISIRESSIQKYINSILAIITKFKKKGYNRQFCSKNDAGKAFLFDLNEKITGAYCADKRYGWLWYFKQMNDIGLLTHIDDIIKRELSRSEETKSFKPKKLKRAYYEIVHNGKNSSYILDYGSNNIAYMKKVLLEIGEDVSSLAEDEIEKLFRIITQRRITRLILDEVRES